MVNARRDCNVLLNCTCKCASYLGDGVKLSNSTTFFTVLFSVIFSRILPFGPEGPKWQDCFDTFCARAQKVQNKGWRSTA